jgi:hypothetical protein
MFCKKVKKNKLKLQISDKKFGPKYKSARKASIEKIVNDEEEINEPKTNIVNPNKGRFKRFRERHIESPP